LRSLNRPRRRRVGGFLALLLLCGTVFGVSYSYAHYVENEFDVYATGDSDCARVRARVGHGVYGNGGIQAEIAARFAQATPWGTYPCAQPYVRPAGYLAVRWYFYRWAPRLEEWQVCIYTGYWYNPSTASDYYIAHNFKSNPPCGSAYYLTQAIGYEYNGGWHGGYVNSPYHWLS
jgi:hypothetical protein